MEYKDFAIVVFTRERNSVGVISSTWLSADQSWCYYPRTSSEEEKDNLIKDSCQPALDWKKCPIRLLHFFDDFDNAVNHLTDAECTSNLESEVDETRKASGKNYGKRYRRTKEVETGEELEESSLSLSLLSYPEPPRKLSKFSPARKAAPLLYPHPITSTQRKQGVNPSFHLASHSSNIEQRTPLSGTDKSIRDEIINLKKVNEELLNRQEDIFSLLKRVENKLDDLMSTQSATLSAQQATAEKATSSMELIQLLPISVDNMEKFEEKLKNSTSLRQEFKKILYSSFGRDCKGFISCCLRRCVSNEVAIRYTLTGKNKTNIEKLAFEKTAVYQIIREVSLKSYEGVKDNVIRDAVSDWLLQAKFRLARRNKTDTNELSPTLI